MVLRGVKHVTIVGVGLLGGSAGLAIKACDSRVQVAGVGRRMESLQAAMEMGSIDSAHLDVAEVVGSSDLIILATPVGAFEQHLRAIKGRLKASAIVTDVGSTKAAVVQAAGRVLGHDQFVGSHPMAGSEQRGPTSARADLFAGATCIITPTAKTSPKMVKRVEAIWQALGMQTVRMTPKAHDRAVAEISHLPHALAGLLMMLPRDTSLRVAASGFRDATRLASGDAEMWRDIFMTNRREVLRALGGMSRSLDRLRAIVSRGDAARLQEFFQAARVRRQETILRVLHDRRMSAE